MFTIPYREAAGSLLSLSRCSRPDIFFAASPVAKFYACPGNQHWNAVVTAFQYLPTYPAVPP